MDRVQGHSRETGHCGKTVFSLIFRLSHKITMPVIKYQIDSAKTTLDSLPYGLFWSNRVTTEGFRNLYHTKRNH